LTATQVWRIHEVIFVIGIDFLLFFFGIFESWDDWVVVWILRVDGVWVLGSQKVE